MKLLLVYCDCLDEIVNVSSCKNCENYKGNDDRFLWCDQDNTKDPEIIHAQT